MPDQLIKYDQALLTWVTDNLVPLQEGRSVDVLVSTPRKGFAEATTAVLADNRRRTLPRIVIQRLDIINDPIRFNPNRIRRLGYCNPPDQNKLISGKFPSPVNIPYQIDLWARFIKEMNIWEQYIMDVFASSYLYLKIRPNDVWGDKSYITFLDGPITDNSDLEPDEKERQIRKTLTFRSEAWIYDEIFVPQFVVKRIQLNYKEMDDTLLEIDHLPPIEIFGTGTGSQTTFTGTVTRAPVLEHTFIIETLIGASTEIAYDDGNGNLKGSTVSSGTINYTTGAVSVTFSTAPDLGADLKAQYFTDQP
jgi:hypothetical protein